MLTKRQTRAMYLSWYREMCERTGDSPGGWDSAPQEVQTSLPEKTKKSNSRGKHKRTRSRGRSLFNILWHGLNTWSPR